MAKFLKWCCGCSVALALLAGIAVFLVWRWAKSQPTNWTAESSIEIAASPEEVLPLLEDLHRWGEWSLFERDASGEVDREFSGAERGVGSAVTWTQARAGTSLTLGKLELKAVGPQGVEYTCWNYGSLRFAVVDANGRVSTNTNVELGGFDQDFEVPGRILLEATEGGCKVTWTESVELGDSTVARILAASVARIAEAAHVALLEQSLEGLKNLSELR